MNIDKAYIDNLGKQLTLTLGYALKNGEVTEEDAPRISSFVLDSIYSLKTQGEALEFLTRLAKQWPVFSKILITEVGQAAKTKDDIKIQQVEELIKENKPEEAIKIAQNPN